MFFTKDLKPLGVHLYKALDFVFEKLKSDGSNKKRFYSAGDPIESFELNEFGHIRNDIDIIRSQTDMRAAENLLNRLQQIEPSNPNAGKSDAEILLSHRSKYCQSPSEVTKYIEFQLELRDSQIVASQVSPNDDTIHFDGQDGAVEQNS